MSAAVSKPVILNAVFPPATTALHFPRRVRVACTLLLIVWTGLLDLFLTLNEMMTVGMYESNPIVVAIATATNSSVAIAGYKIMMMSIGCGILWCFRQCKIAELGGYLVLVAHIGTIVIWFLYLREFSDAAVDLNVDLRHAIRLT